jgi:hypothetical protein
MKLISGFFKKPVKKAGDEAYESHCSNGGTVTEKHSLKHLKVFHPKKVEYSCHKGGDR